MENLPEGHFEHSMTPNLLLYVPPYKTNTRTRHSGFRLQCQSVSTELPAQGSEFFGHKSHNRQVEITVCTGRMEKVPFGHSVQSFGLATGLYLPMKHSVQGTPFCSQNPGAHWQLSIDELAGRDTEFAPHDLQSVTKVCEVSDWNVFAAQSEQVSLPVNDLYRPVPHTVHGPSVCPREPRVALPVRQFVTVSQRL